MYFCNYWYAATVNCRNCIISRSACACRMFRRCITCAVRLISVGFSLLVILHIFYSLVYRTRVKLMINSLGPPNRPENEGCALTLWWDPAASRLGNMFSAYASLYGIAKDLGIPAVVASYPEFPLCQYFGKQLDLPCITDPAFYSFFNAYEFEFFVGKYNYSNLEKVRKNCRKPLRLYHFIHSFKYFKNHFGDIRRQFACPQAMKRQQDLRLKKMIRMHPYNGSADISFVGVHARRGDIVNDLRIGFGYTHATKPYLDKAMSKMEQELARRSAPMPLFFLFGDDYQWNKNTYGQIKNVIVVNPASSIQDYCLLTILNHTIMSVGTYGWWASFMANGLVIYDKKYAEPGSVLASLYTDNDFFPPNWIGV